MSPNLRFLTATAPCIVSAGISYGWPQTNMDIYNKAKAISSSQAFLYIRNVGVECVWQVGVIPSSGFNGVVQLQRLSPWPLLCNIYSTVGRSIANISDSR